MFMLSNQKSSLISELIVIVLVVLLLILVVFPFYDRLSAFWLDRDDGTLNNFEGKLLPKIQDMLGNSRKLDYREEISFYLGGQKYSLVGFEKGTETKNHIPNQAGVTVKKPAGCGTKACICLFEAGETSLIQGNPVKNCAVFDKVSFFLRHPYLANNGESSVAGSAFYDSSLPEIFTKQDYKYMMMSIHNVNELLYIEKYTNNQGEAVIYIAPVKDTTREAIKQRKSYIDSINKI